MKNSYASWVMIVASLCLGSAASTLVSGCQQSKPIAADSEETEPPSVEVPERADDSSTAVTDEPSDEPRSESETATASTDIAAKPEIEPEQKKTARFRKGDCRRAIWPEND